MYQYSQISEAYNEMDKILKEVKILHLLGFYETVEILVQSRVLPLEKLILLDKICDIIALSNYDMT